MQTRRTTAPWKRWLSATAYGLVTRLCGIDTPPRTMRRRFERFATVTRESMTARFPNVVFSGHRAGGLWIEALRAALHPRAPIVVVGDSAGGGQGTPGGRRRRGARRTRDAA